MSKRHSLVILEHNTPSYGEWEKAAISQVVTLLVFPPNGISLTQGFLRAELA